MEKKAKKNYVRVANVNERCCHIKCINDVNTLTFVRIAFDTVWNEGRSGERLKRSWDCLVSFRNDFNMVFVVCFWNSVVWFGQAWLCSAEYVKCKSVIIYEDFGTMPLCSWLVVFDWVYWIWFVTVLFEVSKLSKPHSWISWCTELQSATLILRDTKRYSATRVSWWFFKSLVSQFVSFDDAKLGFHRKSLLSI